MVGYSNVIHNILIFFLLYRAENTIANIRTILLQITQVIVTIGLLFTISAFIYGSFYFAFVPPPIHSGPVHLVFEPCHENQGKCGYLNSSLSLSERNPVLMTGQLYTLTLSLEMPESEVNKHLGKEAHHKENMQ